MPGCYKIVAFYVNLLSYEQIQATMSFVCDYCKREFESSRGLTQHQQRSNSCKAAMGVAHGSNARAASAELGYMTANEHLATVSTNAWRIRQKERQLELDAAQLSFASRANAPQEGEERPVDRLRLSGYTTAREYNSDEDAPTYHFDDDESEDDDASQEAKGSDSESVHVIEGEVRPDETMVKRFQEYCERAQGFVDFPIPQMQAIKLMTTLRKTKASLGTYDAVMLWHLKAKGDLHEHESGRSSPKFFSRHKIFQQLAKRYNRNENRNILSKLTLPSSKATVNIVWTDAKEVITSLLTDPRIKSSDYMFFDDNPLSPPIEGMNYVADLNTGKAYIETYKKLITKPNQVLLPVIIYIDGAVTGQFSDLPITAVKISLGIFTRKARDKPHFWGTLGYIPPVSKDKSRGLRLFIESGHVDATRAVHEAGENEGVLDGNEAVKAQDFHAMLDKILASFVELQKTGFIWDLFYNNQLYKGIEFIPFVPFIKCDTEEADVLCGKYKSRGRNVANLCRYCKCPTDESDNPTAQYELKRYDQIQRLVEREDVETLKAMSQHCIQNATYKLRFGLHNKCGVHGATPLEMLHALLLGIFRYIRDIFFTQTGKKSKTSAEIDALAREFGHLLSRQSDRDKPKTKFSNGIRKGKLMAKEYTGVLLCMLVVLRSSKGKQIVRRMRKYFGQNRLDDWILLLETLLQWEEWMKSSLILKKHIIRARKKHRYIMYIIKIVANRSEGMGLKLTKFHAIVHIADDMLNLGVPMEVDTGSNETGHKPTKTAAKLTQKQKKKFEIQTAARLEEVHLLEMAEEEMRGRPVWDYFEGHPNDAEMLDVPAASTKIGGTAYQFFTDDEGINRCQGVRKINGKYPEFQMEKTFVDWVIGLKDAVDVHIPDLVVHSKLTRNGTIFHANVSFQGGVWRDWVWIDWGPGYGNLPNKLWGFVDLHGLPPNSNVNYGGIQGVKPAMYAIVESTTMNEEEHSELVLTIETDAYLNARGKVVNLRFYLADVDAFVEPAIVVPDIGGKPNGYLLIHNKQHWREKFEQFLEDSHANSKYKEDPPPEEEESEEDEVQVDDDEEESDESEAEISIDRVITDSEEEDEEETDGEDAM